MTQHISHPPARVRHKPLTLLIVLATLAASGGSTCIGWRAGDEILPVVLQPNASKEQILAVINANTARVQSIWATQASLAVPGAPSLSLNLAVQTPRRFRIRAGMGLLGTEFDLGSNDEIFWLWVRRNQPPAIYTCRHDQFAASAARGLIPVEPEWIIEAIGLPHFDPADQPQGPIPVGANRVQIRSIRHSAIGDLSKITVVDPLRGVVLEQHLYDAHGTRLASSFTSGFHRDPLSGAILPRHIQIQYPSTQLDMRIDIADMQVNVLGPQNESLWVKPEYPGYPEVNLANPNQQVPISLGPPQAGTATIPPPDAVTVPPATAAPPAVGTWTPAAPPGASPAAPVYLPASPPAASYPAAPPATGFAPSR